MENWKMGNRNLEIGHFLVQEGCSDEDNICAPYGEGMQDNTECNGTLHSRRLLCLR